eukprot:GILI01007258.1.p1 GENE.GILI01007258.1~~GILI01007258.1.p1  ORF type:complete len:220 (+),score=24.70 GILI01007258.1:60-662(+)
MVFTGLLLWVFDPVIQFSLRKVQPVIVKGIAVVEPHLRRFDQYALGPALRATLGAAYWLIRFAVLWAYPIVAPFMWFLAPIFNWIIIPIVKKLLLPDLSQVKRIRGTCAPWMDSLEEQTFQNSRSAIDLFAQKLGDVKDEAHRMWSESIEEKKKLMVAPVPSPSPTGGEMQSSFRGYKSPMTSSHNASSEAHNWVETKKK